MSMKALTWQIPLALAGIFAGAFIGQELIGDGALGWMATGAIAAATCAPLFRTLLAYRAEKDRLRAR